MDGLEGSTTRLTVLDYAWIMQGFPHSYNHI